MKQKICIVLPAYNEAPNLPGLFKRIDRFAIQVPYWDIQILVVNDGSTDDTLAVATSTSAITYRQLLDLQPNQGLANAMRKGLLTACQNLDDYDVVVALDADDSQNPQLIERMVKQIHEGSDVVIASRFQAGARVYGLTPGRQFMSWGAGMLFRVFAPVKGVKDYTCGFRAYRAGILKKAYQQYGDKFIEEQGFACMAEILLKLARMNAIMHEVPMILRYDRKKGDSKMNVGRTVRQSLQLIGKYAFRK